MSSNFQKLLGDLTVQYMMDVQELRDEVLKLKSENDCLKETDQAVSLETASIHFSLLPSENNDSLKSENDCLKDDSSELTAQIPLSRAPLSWTHESSDDTVQDRGTLEVYTAVSAGMSNEDVKLARRLARLDQTLDDLDPLQSVCKKDDDADPAAEVHKCSRVANFLESDVYELFVGSIILMNVLVMAAVVQVQGTEIGWVLGYPGYSEPSSGWKETNTVFAGLDFLFLGLYTVDLVLRTTVLHIRFFKSPLNWVDLLVVMSGWIELFGSFFLDPFLVRMLRLVKFGRAFRAMQLSKVSHSLKMLGRCITASVGVLFWSLLLLFVIQCIGGMMLSVSVRSFLENAEVEPEIRRIVFRYFGTFSGVMLTMFEVLFANWSIPCRILVVGFAVLNVVNATFVMQTMCVAQQDTEFMIDANEKASKAYARKLRVLFQELDSSGDGLVSWEEFAVLLTDDRLRSFLNAMEIEATDLQGLFDVLGDGSGNISADDFIAGAQHINGPAKAVDMAQLLSIVKRLDSKIESSATGTLQQAELVVATGNASSVIAEDEALFAETRSDVVDPSLRGAAPEGLQQVLVMDAGSSGTRIHIFNLLQDSGHVPRVDQTVRSRQTLKVKPGLSQFALKGLCRQGPEPGRRCWSKPRQV
ncbi:unnamed protein product [Polarella glacialis]|uniref:EF-hand domain-containing protein n=1 Tax=Polarella glacialis TaxID=89957 RepID=A0A813KMG3_POLGL|nr:unnamed protein product [Polarella glacialis]